MAGYHGTPYHEEAYDGAEQPTGSTAPGVGYGAAPYAGQTRIQEATASNNLTLSFVEETDEALSITLVQHAASTRVSREHAEVLVALTPDARISREHLEALVAVTPDAILSREHLETLIAVTPDARLAREHIEVLYFDDGAQVIGVGVAVEVDSGGIVQPGGYVFPGIAVETDEALPITVIGTRYFTVGQASDETDTAQSMVVVERRRFNLNRADETDTAQPIKVAFPVRLAEETDQANPMGIVLGLGRATETDEAFGIGPHRQLQMPEEHDDAEPVYIEWVGNPSGAVDGFGWTQGFSASPGRPYTGSYLSTTATPPAGGPASTAVYKAGSTIPNASVSGQYWASPTRGEYALVNEGRLVAVEVWAYLDGSPDARSTIRFLASNDSQTTSVGVGGNLDVPVGQWVHLVRNFVMPAGFSRVVFDFSVGQLTGDTSGTFPPVLYMAGLSIRTAPTPTITLGTADETDAAQSLVPVNITPVGLATETDTARPIAAGLTFPLATATETDTAQTVTPLPGAVTVAVGLATETDVAQPLTLTGPTYVTVGQATETDEAMPLTGLSGQIVAVGLATETDSALALTGNWTRLDVGIAEELEYIPFPRGITSRVTLILGLATETESAGTLIYDTATRVPVGLVEEIDTADLFTLVVIPTGKAAERTAPSARANIPPPLVAQR